MSKYTLWGIISLIFIWVGIDSLDEDRTLGIIMIMGASFALAYITYLWKKHEGSTLEQLKLMQEMTSNEIEKLRKRKQEIIDEGAKKGEVISTEKVLESLDELKTSYDGDNPEEYFAKIVLNKFKSIVVIDDNSNYEILKKFKNIEFLTNYQLDWGLEVLGINSGLFNYEVEKLK